MDKKIKELYIMYLQFRKVPSEKEIPVQVIMEEKKKDGNTKI